MFLKVDGTYFPGWGCVIVYKEGKNILFWQFAQKEQYGVYEVGFTWLTQAGYTILGVTSDWHGSITASVERLFPDIPHQRCLVHTQRHCEQLITKKPQTAAGVMLLDIVRELNHVTDFRQKKIWTSWLGIWERRYLEFIKHRTHGVTDNGKPTWWYTHKQLRRAYRTLTLTQDHLFLYLDHTNLDKDTNGLEVEFNHLKGKIGSHSGMRKAERRSYISWYLFFKSS